MAHRALEALARASRQLTELFPDGALSRTAPPVELLPPPGSPLRRRSVWPAVRIDPTALRGGKVEILSALLHGMVHYANSLAGSRDCGLGHYHNGRFRDLARRVGLDTASCDPRFGWARTRPSEGLSARLEEVPLDSRIFSPFSADAGAVDSGPNWRCGTNLPASDVVEAWRQHRAPLPEAPRYRTVLVHDPTPHGRYLKVPSARAAAPVLWRILASRDREALAVLFLDSRRRLIGYDVPYVGTLTRASVEPRGILLPALLVNAALIVVGHNHPSGDPTPSREDAEFTGRLKAAAEIVGVRVAASLIVGGPDRWRAL